MEMPIKDKIKAKSYRKDYYKKNKRKYQNFMKKYYNENSEKIKNYTRVYSSEKAMSRGYDRPIKNIIRAKILSYIENYPINSILTLESEDFLFSKELPQSKIFVFENNLNTFKKMRLKKPKNVVLSYGDVSNFKEYNSNVDFIYLDFCYTFSTAKEIIYNLKENIRKARLFAVTFCTWDETKEPNGDYQFDLINKLQTIIGINFKVLFGQGYRDKEHSTMVTIIMENPNV